MSCWYCELAIEYHGFDPCAVILVANWADERSQREQQFFAHAECLRARLHPDVAPLARVLDADWDGDEL